MRGSEANAAAAATAARVGLSGHTGGPGPGRGGVRVDRGHCDSVTCSVMMPGGLGPGPATRMMS